MNKKTKWLLVFFVAVAVIAVAVLFYKHSLSEGTVSITYPENYTVLNADNAYDNEETVKSLGYSVSSFVNHLNSKSIVSMAVNDDNTRQFVLMESKSVFSEEIGSLADITSPQLSTVADALMPNGYIGTYTTGGMVFLENKTQIKGEEKYTATQLVTVINGKTYTVNYYAVNVGGEDTESATEKVAKTLKVPESGKITEYFKGSAAAVYVILLGAVIIFGAVAVILLSVTLVRDFSKKRNQNDSSEIRIKRRTKK